MNKLIGIFLLVGSVAAATTNDIDPNDFKCGNGDESFELRVQYDGRVEVKHFENAGFQPLKKEIGTTNTYIIAEFSGFRFTISLSQEVITGKSGLVYSTVEEGIHTEQTRTYCALKK